MSTGRGRHERDGGAALVSAADELAGAAEDVAPAGAGRSSRQRRHQFPARRRTVNARFTEQEYAAIVAAANRSDLSPTAYVGTAAIAAARGTEVPGAPLREALTELMQARTAAVRIGVAVNKLAAKALSGGEVTARELAAAADASARATARVEDAAAAVHRGLG